MATPRDGPFCHECNLICCRISPSCHDFTTEKSGCGKQRVGLSSATWR